MRLNVALMSIALSSTALFAQAAGGAAKKTDYTMIIMMVVLFAIVYFMMIRPQQKKQKEVQNMLKGVKKGDRIVTIGGMIGVVGSVKEDTVMVKVADNTVVEYRKSAIAGILGDNKTDGLEKAEMITADNSGK